MTAFLLFHEPAIRLGCFLGILSVMAIWEARAPRRSLALARPRRWPANLGIAFLGGGVLRLLFPAGAVGAAVLGQELGWGLLNQARVPAGLAVPLSILALDLTIYLQHRLFHAVPLLWRLHRVHHADLDIDVTTGARFHPLEIILSMLLKTGVVLLLGALPVAVLLFEVLLNATAMFNHGNVRLPAALDRILRCVVVTPDMHRVHHSVVVRETNSNFGFNLPWWDRLFGTYRAQPEAGHEGMSIGLYDLRDPLVADRIVNMLALPFQGSDKADDGRHRL